VNQPHFFKFKFMKPLNTNQLRLIRYKHIGEFRHRNEGGGEEAGAVSGGGGVVGRMSGGGLSSEEE
jgi:hypothetical protein